MSGDDRNWWQGAGAPDLEALLGPDGAAAVGGVADEALKLFMALRERASEAAAERGAQDLGSVLSALAGTAVRAVAEFAAASEAPRPGPAADRGARVPPSEAQACSYCPVCQVISVLRSVPMETWQQLAGSIVDVADKVEVHQADRVAQPAVEVVPTGSAAAEPVAEFLAGLREFRAGGRPGG